MNQFFYFNRATSTIASFDISAINRTVIHPSGILEVMLNDFRAEVSEYEIKLKNGGKRHEAFVVDTYSLIHLVKKDADRLLEKLGYDLNIENYAEEMAPAAPNQVTEEDLKDMEEQEIALLHSNLVITEDNSGVVAQ